MVCYHWEAFVVGIIITLLVVQIVIMFESVISERIRKFIKFLGVR